MAKTFSFDLDMNKGERSDQIVYGRAGDKQSVNIVANLKLDGATWTPPSGDVNAYFECITGDNKSIRVEATLSDSTVSVSLPTDVYSFFGIVSNAYFRIEVGSSDSPTYVESSASFSVYVFGSTDTAYTAFDNSAELIDWRKLNGTLNEVINQANASINATMQAFNEQFAANKSRIDQAVSGANQVIDEADSLKNGELVKPLKVSEGGTGSDNVAQARSNLGIISMPADPLPVANGGTGAITAAQACSNLGISKSALSGNYNDLTNKPAIPATPISIANGGTGANTAAQARANLGAGTSSFSGSYTDLTNKPSIPSVPISVAYGGTGNTTGLAASANKLATARAVTTDLSSTVAASFDGTVNITPGVSGILGAANGGTGAATLAAALTPLGIHSTNDRVDISCDSSYEGEPARVAAWKDSASGEVGGCVDIEGKWLFVKDPSLAVDGIDVSMSALWALLAGMGEHTRAGESAITLGKRLADAIQPVVLYNGGNALDYDTAPGAGTNGTVTLSEDVSHFKEITIVYRAALTAGPKGGNKSVTVPMYPGAYAQLDCVKWDNDGRDVCQFASASYLLSGTSLSYASRVYGQIYTGSNSGTFGSTDGGQPCIIRVTGRR